MIFILFTLKGLPHWLDILLYIIGSGGSVFGLVILIMTDIHGKKLSWLWPRRVYETKSFRDINEYLPFIYVFLFAFGMVGIFPTIYTVNLFKFKRVA
jgi:hypothetical protein